MSRLHHLIRQDARTLATALPTCSAQELEAEEKGLTPLLFAAQVSRAQSFDLLLQAGANISTRCQLTGSGVTHYLLRHTQSRLTPEHIQVLLEKGLDLNQTDFSGRTAIQSLLDSYALRFVHVPAILALLDAGASPPQNALSGLFRLRLNTIAPLSSSLVDLFHRLSQGVDLNAPIPCGDVENAVLPTPPLLWAAEHMPAWVPHLLAAGANPHQTTHEGHTALDKLAGFIPAWWDGESAPGSQDYLEVAQTAFEALTATGLSVQQAYPSLRRMRTEQMGSETASLSANVSATRWCALWERALLAENLAATLPSPPTPARARI